MKLKTNRIRIKSKLRMKESDKRRVKKGQTRLIRMVKVARKNKWMVLKGTNLEVGNGLRTFQTFATNSGTPLF